MSTHHAAPGAFTALPLHEHRAHAAQPELARAPAEQGFHPHDHAAAGVDLRLVHRFELVAGDGGGEGRGDEAGCLTRADVVERPHADGLETVSQPGLAGQLLGLAGEPDAGEGLEVTT